jgi:hypothetical protein
LIFFEHSEQNITLDLISNITICLARRYCLRRVHRFSSLGVRSGTNGSSQAPMLFGYYDMRRNICH